MPNDNPQHILVIRLSAMGDVAMMVPVFLSLKELYPNLEITVLTRKIYAPILKPVPGLRIYEARVDDGRHKGLRGLLKLFRELRRLPIEAVADLHNVLRSKLLKLWFKRENIPFVQIDKGRAEKRALTAGQNKDFRPLKSTHQRYAEVFEKLGYAVDLERVTLLPRQKLTDKIQNHIGSDHRKWIGIAPFAAYSGKCYPLPLMEQVLEEVLKTEKYKIILFGNGSEERKYLEAWAATYSQCINAAGYFSLAEELVLISNLDLMVSMDSANGHLAANYGIPVLTLWGLTHPYAGFSPFRQDPENAILADRKLFPAIPTSVYGNKMPSGYEAAMETITPSMVVARIGELLQKETPPLRH